jgi:hypothetical protein
LFSFYNLLNPSSKKAYYDEHQEQIQNARAAKPAAADRQIVSGAYWQPQKRS